MSLTSVVIHPTVDTPPYGAVQPAVLYRCTSFFDIDGSCHEQVFGWDVLLTAQDAYQRMRVAAVGVASALPSRTAEVLRRWLADADTLPALERLRHGGVYELELASSGSRIVLSLCPILLLPLVNSRPGACPALMPRGRRIRPLTRGCGQAGTPTDPSGEIA